MIYNLVPYTELQNEDWPLVHFAPRELACKHCGQVCVSDDARRAWQSLDMLRHLIKTPIRVTSGTRCYHHNKAVGGAPNSYHLRGCAFDLTSPQFHQLECHVLVYGRECGFSGFGIYRDFIHVDTRSQNRDRTSTIWSRL